MIGVITTKDVLQNAGLIWREYGIRCVARALVSCALRRRKTFLEIVFR